ncbi:MAG: hypothetical protein J3K34DRAFT_436595 [Monoraphidium minutum]|nr:MAG: hypothetical protein J3K34DRAFT_436595 [Monoraphidium minutum]
MNPTLPRVRKPWQRRRLYTPLRRPARAPRRGQACCCRRLPPAAAPIRRPADAPRCLDLTAHIPTAAPLRARPQPARRRPRAPPNEIGRHSRPLQPTNHIEADRGQQRSAHACSAAPACHQPPVTRHPSPPKHARAPSSRQLLCTLLACVWGASWLAQRRWLRPAASCVRL